MKIFTVLFTVVAFCLIVFNASRIDANAPFKGESMIASITIIALLCAIVLLQILRISKRIERTLKDKK